MTRAFSNRSVRKEELVSHGPLSLSLLVVQSLTGLNISTGQFSGATEVDTDEFTETGGVVVTHGLGVTEGLKDGIGLDDLILQASLLLGSGILVLLFGGTDGGEVRNYLLGVFRLSGTRLSSDQHRLILVVGQHVDVGTVRNGEDVGWHLVTALATVHLGATHGVHGEPLVGIDGHAEQTGVGLRVVVGHGGEEKTVDS